MASVGPMNQGMKQTRGYFVPLGNCVDKIYALSGASGAGGSFVPGTFSAATWVTTPATAGVGANGAFLSSISSIGQGGLLRDMGKTVVSSNRTFRKVQLIVPGPQLSNTNNYSPGGVNGVNTTTNPFLTGYIELAIGQTQVSRDAAPAPVAYMPGLL